MRPADLAVIAQTRADLASGSARAARVALKIGQGEIAEAMGVHRSAVGHWEAGRCIPSAAHALAYAKLLRQLARKGT
jgi:DNA-binding XRE family transcriptional regulator